MNLSDLNGYVKTVYADDGQYPLPEYAVVQQKIPFRQMDKLGKSYNFPVKVRRGQGYTFNGGVNAGTAFTLNAARSGRFEEATATGTEFVHRDVLSYGAASRAAQKGRPAFGDAVDELVLDMTEASAFMLELMLIYGGTSIGGVQSNPSGAGTGTQVFKITAASWAPGVWGQLEGAPLDAYDPTLTTKRNANAPIVVSAVDADQLTRQITVTGNISDLDAIADGDVFVPLGAVGNWSDGLVRCLSNTGTLFGINAATYTAWKGNTYGFGGQATMAKFQNMVTQAVSRGLMEDIDVLISPFPWTDLNNDHAALRRFAQSTKAGIDLGTNSIEYYGVNGGVIRLIPHPMVKLGDAIAVPFNRFRRVGSTDLTFRLNNGGFEGDQGSDSFFKPLENQAGFEMRCYWDQCLMPLQPSKGVYGSGITSTVVT